MGSTVFEFNENFFTDALITGKDHILRENLEKAFEVVKAGGKVVIRRVTQGTFAPHVEIIYEIKNVPDFLDWVKHLNGRTGFNISF